MPTDAPDHPDRLPILREVAIERNVFSLEMGPEGVRLRLGGAVLGDVLAVRDLVLTVVHVPGAFDYTAGPRSLQGELTRLEAVTLEVPVEGLAGRVRGLPGIEVAGLKAADGRVSVSGTVDGAPFTLRLVPEGTDGGPGDLALRFDEPRVYGWIGRDWDRLGPTLAGALPVAVAAGADRQAARLDLLRPVLVPLMAGMGWKVPRMDGVGLAAVRVEDGRLVARFEAGATPVRGRADGTGAADAADAGAEPEAPEAAARQALEGLAAGRGAEAARALRSGVAAPRLWPEVLVAARTVGEDRPEWVLPHLVGLLLAARMPELVGTDDVAILARRLLAAVEASGDAADLALAGRLVATVSLGLPPAEALALVDAVRVRGGAEPAVLEAAALALDRLGRGAEARAARARLLALVPAGRTGEVLRDVVDRLDRAGLAAVASGWLDETIARCDEGRFGSEGAAIRRRAVLLCAAREALAGDPAGRARLRDLLRSDPSDPEVLDLLGVTARSDREVAETVAALREAASGTSGAARAAFLREAARATADRLGLRRQAVPLLEEALDADPRDPATAEALDRLCAELGMDDRRLALARSRLAFVADPEARAGALLQVARLAEGASEPAEAARCVAEVLAGDPTNREALEAGIRVFAAAGDEAALVRAWEALLDLDAHAL